MPTFPGVYPQIADNSFNNGAQNRFTCALFGVAARGPFNEVIRVTSIGDYAAKFGASIAGSYVAQAVSAITDYSETSVIRIGRQYTSAGTGSGTQGSYTISTGQAPFFAVNDYVRIRQGGLATTASARVAAVGTASLTLVSVGVDAAPLAATYSNGIIGKSAVANSANEAEGFMVAPIWGTAIASIGGVVGTKNTFEFTCGSSNAALAAGDIIKIEQADRATTREAYVTEVIAGNTVRLLTSTNTETGIQAITLQDNYTAATVKKLTSVGTTNVLHLLAATAGTWANTVGTDGLSVQVMPGTAADSKRFLVYHGGALAQTIDNVTFSNSSATTYVVPALAGSSYVNAYAFSGSEPPLNTRAPWNTFAYTAANTATFVGGANGASVTAADYIGTYNPATDTRTGIKVIDDPSAYQFYVVAAPGNTDNGVQQELARVGRRVFGSAILDIPDNLNAYEAIDWHNAQGVYASGARLDTYSAAFFWNWFQSTDVFTGVVGYIPPSVAYLRNAARVFEQGNPWDAVAGEQRGRVDIASGVRYPRVSTEAKNAMYGNGNCLNPILFFRGGSILIYGDHTAQRVDSKLSAQHTVNLVNYIVVRLSAISRKYVFDPNDTVLLDQLRLEYTAELDTITTRRGLEAYLLVVDTTNNTAATRNARNVIVDLAVIPTDVAERIFINLSVNESGAVLNTVTA